MGRPDPITAAIYPAPDPVRAYRLDVSHGRDAVLERWHWVPPQGLIKVVALGRVLAGDGHALGCPEAAERHRALVDEVFKYGGVGAAADALGISPNPFWHALKSQGVTDYPRMSHAERTRRSSASRQRNRSAAAAEQAIPP